MTGRNAAPVLVGGIGFEPTTPTMSRWCSNQLSYPPNSMRILAYLRDSDKFSEE